ncbi:hypothetical protein CHRYSEOSP005_27880 [Chryseobacterium sp. Alg-005]|uniref:relaxase/mobilization nuclease domain-containing protein n=1 Tax=Chryseobacterium sp. Alg-005 TaxID=3159516 RepID=UPI00355588D7
MKTSINFKPVKPDSEVHNFRKKTFDYIRKDLTTKNEYWQEDKVLDRLQKIEAYCKEKSGRKLQKNAIPVREAVVVIKEDTTMKDLHDLAEKLRQELGIRTFQIAIHKDEGHWDKESKEWKPNFHAHLVADWQDLKTGKTLKHQSFHYSKMQDLAAECLGMERGISSSVGRLETVEFKIRKKEEELSALEEKIIELRAELDSRKFEDLIVKEADFLGFQRIKTDKTIANYEKTFKVYNMTLLKNKNELESKAKQIAELKVQTKGLKRRISLLKNKNTSLLTNTDFFALEKKKYIDSVIHVLEKSIRHERFNSPHLYTLDYKNIVSKMDKICRNLSIHNQIPLTAFEEIFKVAELATSLFSLLNFGERNHCEPEYIPVTKKKKRRIIKN